MGNRQAKKQAADNVETLINEHKVIVFSKTWCPFCTETKKMLDDANVKYFNVDLDLISKGDDFHRYLKKKSK